MWGLRLPLTALCLSLPCAYASPMQAADLGDRHAPIRLAVVEACSGEAKSSNDLDLVRARIQAARDDLNLSHGGSCRPNALKLEQYAYRALESLESQASHESNPGAKKQHLDVIHQAMGYLRDAEQAVEQSLKTDPKGQAGVDVTALDSATHALESYPTATAGGESDANAGPVGEQAKCNLVPSPESPADEPKVVALLTAARTNLSGIYHGECRQAALSVLEAAGHNLEVMTNAEVGTPSFPSDKTKEKQRLAAIERARKYQMDAATEVQNDLKQDPQAKMGVNVSPIDNAVATLKAAFGG